MPLRAPRNFWEWALLFAPVVVVWLTTLIASVLPAPGFEWGLYQPMFGVLAGSTIALGVCVFAGRVLTKPHPELFVRRARCLAAATLIAFFNFSIAFAGCALVLR